MSSTKVLSIVIAAKDKAVAPIKRVVGAVRSMTRGIGAATKAALAPVRALLAGLNSILGVMIGFLAFRAIRGLLSDLTLVERKAAEVATLTGDSGRETIRQLSEDIRGAAVRGGQDFEDQFQAAYDAISAGVPKESLVPFLDEANKLAIAGVTDAGTAVDLLTTAMNVYQKGVGDASDISDIFFQTVKGGKTNVEEIAGFLFQVAPAAEEAGIGMDQVGASLAALTAAGRPTRVATTQIRSMLQELGKDGTKASRAFERTAGVGFRDFIAQGGDVAEAMDVIRAAASKSDVAVSDLFTSVEGGSAAATFAGAGYAKLVGELEAMENRAGSTEQAYQTMADTISFRFGRAKAAVRDLFATFLDSTASGAIRGVLDEVTDVAVRITSTIRAIRDGDSSISDAVGDIFVSLGGVVREGVAGIMLVIGIVLVEMGSVAASKAGRAMGANLATGFARSATSGLTEYALWWTDGIQQLFGVRVHSSPFEDFVLDIETKMLDLLETSESSSKETAEAMRSAMSEIAYMVESETDATLSRVTDRYAEFKRTLGDAGAILKSLGLDGSEDLGLPDIEQPDPKAVEGWAGFIAGVSDGLGKVTESVKTTRDFASGAVVTVTNSLADGFANAAVEVLSGTKSMKDAFMDLGRQTLEMVSKMIIKFLILRAVAGAFGDSTGASGQLFTAADVPVDLFSSGGSARKRRGRKTSGLEGFVPGVDRGHDSILAALRPGEHVMPKDEVDRLGRGNLERLRAGGSFDSITGGGRGDAAAVSRAANRDLAAQLASAVSASIARATSGGASGGAGKTEIHFEQKNVFEGGGSADETSTRKIRQESEAGLLEALQKSQTYRASIQQSLGIKK